VGAVDVGLLIEPTVFTPKVEEGEVETFGTLRVFIHSAAALSAASILSKPSEDENFPPFRVQ